MLSLRPFRELELTAGFQSARTFSERERTWAGRIEVIPESRLHLAVTGEYTDSAQVAAKWGLGGEVSAAPIAEVGLRVKYDHLEFADSIQDVVAPRVRLEWPKVLRFDTTWCSQVSNRRGTSDSLEFRSELIAYDVRPSLGVRVGEDATPPLRSGQQTTWLAGVSFWQSFRIDGFTARRGGHFYGSGIMLGFYDLR